MKKTLLLLLLSPMLAFSQTDSTKVVLKERSYSRRNTITIDSDELIEKNGAVKKRYKKSYSYGNKTTYRASDGSKMIVRKKYGRKYEVKKSYYKY